MKFALVYIGILMLSFAPPADKSALRWVISSGCSLHVNGNTNINKFSCAITNYSRPDTISINRIADQSLQLSGNMQLDVQYFDCHNAIMTADLRKTLKAKEYPRMGIYFIDMDRYPAPGASGVKGTVVISLAGVSKRFEVDYRTVAADAHQIQLEGTRKINFSDFNLTPPRKLGGMIKTNNELSVVFNLNLRVLK